ncbi:hypothetical protein GCM10027048_05920 [Hymenobacter coalescens]
MVSGPHVRFATVGLTRGAWALELYTRWGQLVHASPEYRHDWGADAAPGVYYYRLHKVGSAEA